MQEPIIVVVVQEVAKNGDIFKDRVSTHSIVNGPHTLLVLEGILEVVVHRVLEGAIYIALVTRYIVGVAIKHFSNGVYASRLDVLGPEVLMNFWDGVYVNSIDAVLLDSIVHPLLERGANEGVGLVQIREVGQPTHFNLEREKEKRERHRRERERERERREREREREERETNRREREREERERERGERETNRRERERQRELY